MQRLKQENIRIDTIARDREHQLKLISNPDGVKQYKDLLDQFNVYMDKNQEAKQKQMNAMGNMLGMLNN